MYVVSKKGNVDHALLRTVEMGDMEMHKFNRETWTMWFDPE